MIDEAHLHQRQGRADGGVAARRVQPGLRHRRRAFGQAVAVVERQAEHPLHRQLEIEVQHRPARRQITQGRRVGRAAGDGGMLHQLGVHGRNTLEHRHPILFQGLPHRGRREAGNRVQAAAGIERAEAGGGQPEDMADRQHAIGAVAGSQPAHPARHRGDEQQAAVRQHHALRLAGGAGGVDQRADLPLVAGMDRLRIGVEQRTDGHRRQLPVAQRFGAVAGGMGGAIGGHRIGIEDPARPAMVADAVDFAVGQAGVDDHRPGVALARRQDQGDGGEAVLADDHHPVAAAHPQPVEMAGGKPDRLSEAAVAPFLPPVEQGGGVRRPFRPGERSVADARRQRRHHPGEVGNRPPHSHAASRIMLRAMTSCWIWVVPS